MKQSQYLSFIDWNSFLYSGCLSKSGSLTLSDLYYALTIHGLPEQATLPSSVLDIQQFWKTTGYNVGDLVYSLDDIEHGIMRGEWLSCRGRGQEVRCIVWTTLSVVS